MGRKLAAVLLRTALQYSSPESRQWAHAMIGELDFIEGNWAALFWAVGSTTAIFGHSARCSWSCLRRGGYRMNGVGKKILGILSGAAIAVLLASIALGFVTLSFQFFPSFAERATWFPWFTLIVIPMIAFAGIGAAQWRKRRPIAVGIFLSAFALGTHFAIRIATHGIS